MKEAPPTRGRLYTKLLISYLIVVAVGALTLAIVMSLVTPLFYDQLMANMMRGMMGGSTGGMMGGGARPGDVSVAATFRETVTYSLLVATGVSSVAALAVSLYVSRRLGEPVQRLAAASRRIAAGHYAERVDASSNDEVGDLAHSFNEMAASLEETERRRVALVGDVAHELRTPLSTIEGYAEGLMDGVVEPSPETFALLHTEAGRLRRLVDDLQELSRVEARQVSLHPRPTPPSRLLQAAAMRLGPHYAEKGVQLSVDAGSDLPAVMADEDRAVQVLTNLLGNALRYTPNGGRVEATASRRGDVVAFTVADSGAGIAAEHLPHLFERFYRADRSRSRAGGGSGIGLTIAKHLVELQGGSIVATSPGPGQGATFTFTLPQAG
ncbi:MAG: sensor histidine kinase [Chloroflexota bacterium]